MSSPRSSIDSPTGLSGIGSASRLVLLPNADDEHDPQEYTDDDDEHEDADPQLGITQLPIPPLSPSLVFLYLLAPYLRLGAVYALDFADAPLAYGFAALVVAASLSAFCRQIWFLLGRYLRKTSMEDILVHTFVRRHRTARSARSTVTIISGSFRLLSAAMYLRDSVDSALLLDVPESSRVLFSSRLAMSILLSILAFVLSFPKSLDSKPTIYATGLSVASYLAWLVAMSLSHDANELLLPSLNSFRRGALWTEISSLTFACTTTMTVPLSASLLAGTPLVPPASKNSRMRSFELLNMSSATLAVLLMLPVVVIAASPRTPASAATSNNLILGLRIATLVLSIPSVIVSITLLPSPGRFIRTNTALSIIVVATLALSLVPHTVASILGDVMLFFAVVGGFLLPALAHITIHYFRRPLAIVVPQAPPSAPSSPRLYDAESSPSPSRDPLLQRKERLLQRSRFGKRLLWDFAIWIFLIPACVCALVWAAGRLARQS